MAVSLAVVCSTAGCFDAGERLAGVTRDEALAAAVLAINDDAAELDLEHGFLVRRFRPGELAHRQGPQRVVSLDAGSRVRIRVHEVAGDAATLEVTCTEERYTPPVPPVQGLRDPAWEEFLRGEIIERLRWNRLRVIPPDEPDVQQSWNAVLVNAYRMLGLEVKTAASERGASGGQEPDTGWQLREVQRARDGLRLALLGRDESSSMQWLLLAGPTRIGGDIALDSIITQARAAGFEPKPLAELPASR